MTAPDWSIHHRAFKAWAGGGPRDRGHCDETCHCRGGCGDGCPARSCDCGHSTCASACVEEAVRQARFEAEHAATGRKGGGRILAAPSRHDRGGAPRLRTPATLARLLEVRIPGVGPSTVTREEYEREVELACR